MDSLAQARETLRAVLSRRQVDNPRYSLRAFARDLKVSPSVLSEVLNGKRVPSRRIASRIVGALSVSEPEFEAVEPIFERLVSGDKVKRRSRRVSYTLIDADSEVVKDRHCFAILSLMETVGFVSDPEWIARRLGISQRQALRSIKALEQQGCITRGKNRGYVLTGRHYRTTDGVGSDPVRELHRDLLKAAARALERDPPDARDFCSFAMAIDPRRIPEAKDMIRRFAEQIMRFLEGGEKREVYHMSFNLFSVEDRPAMQAKQ